MSSSSAASSICSKVDGNIFIDCTDLGWKGVQALEQTKDFKKQGIITNGTQGQIATWKTVVSTSQGHDNVIEVQYRDTDTHNALVHFVANTPNEIRDMSAYTTGKLMFDIKLLNAGKFSPQLSVMMECIYPCVSHGHPIAIPALNQWTSVEVPIAEFIEGGLKITETGISFQIVPDWNNQNGVQFQLDNIRWVKGTGVAPTPETHCYEQRFETWGLPYHFDTLVGATSLTTGALTQIISTSLMTPNWSSTTDKLGYAPRTDSSFTPCAFTDGKISAQIYAPKSYVDDGKMRVGLYYEDSSARRAYFPPVSAASLTADAWKTISVPLVTTHNAPAFSAVDAAFDINNINYAGVYFDANGKPANVGGMLRVDNIFITGNPVTPSVASSSSSVATSSSSKSSSSSLIKSSSSSPTSGSSTSSSSSKSSTQSVSSSSAAIVNCASTDGAVFVDSVCSGWRDASYFELKKTATYVPETEDGSPGNLLTLSTINTGEAGHYQVLDIAYNGNNDYNAIARIRNPTSATTGVDMSAYATGKLVFDLKVISLGDAKEPLNLVLDCGYPCENTPHLIKTSTLNQWKTVEVSIGEMIKNGLDIKHIYTGFQLSPPWNLQKNVHFQVDNIRWVKGPQVIPTTEVCYAQHFDRKDWTYGVRTENFFGSATTAVTATAPVSVLSPIWASSTDRWGYIHAPVKDTDHANFQYCLGNSTKMSFSVYVPAAYVTDGNMTVGLVFRDWYGNIATSTLKSASELKPDDWNTIEVNINLSHFRFLGTGAGVFADAAFKANDITHMGVYFDANGKKPSITGDLGVDNIVMTKEISEPVASSSSSLSSLATSSSSKSSSTSKSSHSSSVKSSSSSPASASSSSKASCSVSAKVSAITPKVGFGIASGNQAFLTIKLRNANYVAPALDVSLANATLLVAHSSDSKRVYQISANAFILQSSEVNISFGYQQLDSSANVWMDTSLYDTPSTAVNESIAGLLHTTNTLIVGPASCGQ